MHARDCGLQSRRQLASAPKYCELIGKGSLQFFERTEAVFGKLFPTAEVTLDYAEDGGDEGNSNESTDETE